MSGHSKWHSIKHKKGANDAARGKIFTRHAKIITIVARDGGGNPDDNPSLKTAIDNAKKDNMPNLNIERAIKKGIGEDKDGVQIMEANFEGYAPGGVAVFVTTVTDNKNRTVASLRSAFSKNGGNLGENGSVAWMFHKKGRFETSLPSADKHDELELMLIDAGAQDISESGNSMEIICESSSFDGIKKILTDFGIQILEDNKMDLIPENTIKINDESTAKKVMNLISVLEEDDDVTNVFANFDIPEELLQRIAE